MKAIAYYRVSSAQQAEKESIHLQKYAHKNFFQEKGYDLVEDFEDDGISGEDIDKRPGFQKALERLKKGDIDVFVVYMVDRIGRFKRRRDRNTVIELLEESRTHIHVSEEDVIFHWNKEKEINDLEYELNASRRENVIRGKRIANGHQTKRDKNRYSGGLLPYGVRFDKVKGTFHEVPAEVDTLQTILDKLTAGWGLHRVRDYLNDHLDQYPKRARKFNDKLVTKWSAEAIREMVNKDFLFTGIVDRTPKSRKKGILPITTGKKLFDEEVVKTARREMQVRRVRNIDPKREGRKRLHSQQDKTVFTDALLHGIARCGHCGWKLGIQKVDVPGYHYLYYICRGRGKNKCNFKNVRAEVLDKNVWNEFVATLENPAKLERMILDQNFIVDKKLEQKRAEYVKAQADYDKISGVIERVKNQYKWGHSTEDEYKADLQNYERLLTDAQDRANNLKQIIEQPKAVRESVKKATQYVADQLMVFWTLDKLKKQIRQVDDLLAKTENIAPGDSEEVIAEKGYHKLKALKLKIKVFEIADMAMDELRKTRKPMTSIDRKNPDIKLLTFQQKRLMFHQFINNSPGKSIRVFDAKNFALSLYVRSNLFNNFGNKEGENKQGNREKNFKGNQLGPVSGCPDFF